MGSFSNNRIFANIGIVDHANRRLTEYVFVRGLRGTKTVEALVDTGAQRSLVDVFLANEIGIKLTGRKNNVGGLERDSQKLEAELEIFMGQRHNKQPRRGEMYFKLLLTIWEDLRDRVGFPLLLGMDFLLAAEQYGEKFTIEIG